MGGDPRKRTRGTTVVLEDEGGFALAPYVARTWSPVGTPATLVHSFGRWEKVGAISGVAVRLRHGRIEAEQHFRLLPGRAVGSRAVADFLRQLARHLRGRGVVV